MDAPHEIVGRTRDDREGANPLAHGRVLQVLPDARQGEGLARLPALIQRFPATRRSPRFVSLTRNRTFGTLLLIRRFLHRGVP